MTKILLPAVVACTIAFLLYLSLDSGRFAPPAQRLFSLPLCGLAAIFGARAWTSSMSADPRPTPFWTGLAIGVGAYALARLVIA